MTTQVKITIVKTSEVIKLINYMYIGGISMTRKKEKCLEYQPVNKVIDRNINCIYCSSTLVIKNGLRNNKQRFKCSNCNKGFTLSIN